MPLYLDTAKVKAGDIVLTGGKGNLRSIKVMTLSRYTHALLMVSNRSMLEAAEPRKRLSATRLPGWEFPDGRKVVELDGDVAIVLRPSTRALVAWSRKMCRPPSDFPQQLRAASAAYLGRLYSNIPRLGKAAIPALRWIPLDLLARHFRPGQWQAANHPRPTDMLLKRWFCSELVAQAYADAHLPLARIGTASPGTLARRRWLGRLKRVPDAVITTDKLPARPLWPQLGPVSGLAIDGIAAALLRIRAGRKPVNAATVALLERAARRRLVVNERRIQSVI